MFSRVSRNLCVGVALFALLAMYAQGQTHSKSTKEAEKAPVAKWLSIDDIVKMSKAGLGDEIIVQQIRKKGHAYDLAPDELIQLKTASVSNHVISVMMDPSKPEHVAVAAAAAAPVAVPRVELSLDEIGVYAKLKGDWTEVLPEVVNFKTGGVFKNIASAGIVKGDVNGHVEGPSSKLGLTTPVEIRIVMDKGVAITEYQLVRLHQNLCDSGHGGGTNMKNSLLDCGNREFRTVTGGVMHVKGGATRDLITFDGKKITNRAYEVTFTTPLAPGEYGFLPPGLSGSGSMAALGKIYLFRVIE